jgi:hypothetical protein
MPNRPLGHIDFDSNVEVPGNNVEPLGSDNFLGGLITDNDPSTISPTALQNLLNVVYDRNLLLRRNGLTQYSIAKPNSNKVMAVFVFFQTSQGVNLFRITRNTIHKATSAGWVAYAGTALTGTDVDYFNFTVADNRAFFTNNGVNVIQEILPGTNSWANLGNAPQYKYITSAFNRIIGANLAGAGAKPYQIGWSGDLNYGEWNPLTDISAGLTPLVDSPADLSDDITGVFNLASVLCIVRQRSIWLATKQPSATNPFNFFIAVPRIGCDTPRSICLFADGLLFYNFLTSSVYYYAPGPYKQDQPQDISGPIKRFLKSSIDDPSNVFGSFSYDRNTYTIYINSSSGTLTKAFSFNLNTKTWSYEEFSNLSAVADIDYNTSTLAITGLTGLINALSGSISSLGGLVANASKFFGFNTGELNTQSTFSGFASQTGNITLSDSTGSFSTIIDSKTITVPLINAYISKCRVLYTPYSIGNVSLFYSKDDGVTWNLYKTVSVINSMLNKSQFIQGNKFLNCRRFIWRLSTSDCMLAVNGFNLELAEPENNRGPISRR